MVTLGLIGVSRFFMVAVVDVEALVVVKLASDEET